MKGGIRALRGRGFYAPRFSVPVYRLMQALSGPYLRFAEGVRSVRVEGMERLEAAMRKFHAGDERLLILFRHVAKEDAPVMVRLLAREFPRWCRRRNISINGPAHAHYLYGKDVLNWAGAGARWMFPRIGGIPVVNSRVDRQSQETIRTLLTGGQLPLAFAPEGQVTYHMFRVADLAPGTATFASWAMQDLRHQPDRKVRILPVAIGYRPAGDLETTAWALAQRLRKMLHLPVSEVSGLDDLLLQCADGTASFLERSYRTEYPGIFPDTVGADLQERFDILCDGILRCGEAVLGWQPAGTILDRIFRLRYWSMDSMYREDCDPARLPPLEQSRANYRAAQAKLLKRHEETVDILEYIRPDYLESPGILRRIEFALNLLDVLNRAQGGNIDSRYTLKNKNALVHIGESIPASDLLQNSGAHRRESRAELNRKVRRSFEQLAVEMEEQMEAAAGPRRVRTS